MRAQRERQQFKIVCAVRAVSTPFPAYFDFLMAYSCPSVCFLTLSTVPKLRTTGGRAPVSRDTAATHPPPQPPTAAPDVNKPVGR